MTPSTTARPTMVRTMLPLAPALLAAAAVSFVGRFSAVFSPFAAKTTGAVSRQPKVAAAAAGMSAGRVRITEGVSPDQAQAPYRQAPPRALLDSPASPARP